jgi:hypothetical protein
VALSQQEKINSADRQRNKANITALSAK